MSATYERKVYADTEGSVRTWLRNDEVVAPLVSTSGGTARVFFGVPQNPLFPLISLYLVGGGPDSDGPAIDASLIQIDCWGEGQNKAQAAELKGAVIGAIESLEGGTLIAPGVKCLSAFVSSVLWVPNPGSNQARYSITAEFATVATGVVQDG